MIEDWPAKETSTHQDHVIAHILGATALGYIVWNETVYILLDIGFLWMIYRDGEMGLLPHPVAVAEMEISEPGKDKIKADIDVLLRDGDTSNDLQLLSGIAGCEINEVSFCERGDDRRLLISGKETNLVIETSLASTEINVSAEISVS